MDKIPELPKLPVVGYVIYIPSRDVYSRGGYYIRTGKARNAKIWGSLGRVRSHLAQHIELAERDYDKYTGYGGYRVVRGYEDDAIIVELTSGERRLVKDEYEAILEKRHAP